MQRTTIKNLRIGYGASLLILIISSIASFVSIRHLLNNTALVNRSTEFILELENVISILKDAETGQRGFLITGNQEFLTPYNGSYERAMGSLEKIAQYSASDQVQSRNTEKLRLIIETRLKRLNELLIGKRVSKQIETQDLQKGKEYMDEARRVVKRMEDYERQVLNERTSAMNEFSVYTPILIVLAAVLSFIITIISYLRARKDFDQRYQLYGELEQKDAEINRRIEVIEDIASKISNGDFSARVEVLDDKDTIGSLAKSLNTMAISLENSFQDLSDKEWLQTGIANLNDQLIGILDIDELSQNVLNFLISYTHSQVGALYLSNEADQLILKASHAIAPEYRRPVVLLGEGITGQCAIEKKMLSVSGIETENLQIGFAGGAIQTRNIVAFPIVFENKVRGVIELGSMDSFTTLDKEYFLAVTHNVGVAVNTSQNRARLQELLEETQAQAEELQTQHSELESMNTELEAQAQKLQASEEELKVQQEELLQANQELEERSKALEEKNQLILERNLDIQQKAEELELSTRYKSEFLANMSHELRTPLNSILLLSRLLAENNEQNLNGEQVEYANVIQSSGNGLLSLIDEILDLSKIESGKMELDYHELAPQELLNSMKALFYPIAREKNLEFQTEIVADVPALISTDQMRLEQVLKNLISNALKFTSRGFVKLSISPDKSREHYLIFTVKDTGIGIASDKQQHIFEAFQQEDGSTRRKYGGTGLGLSISRELARLLGGEIILKSEQGQGSEFIVSIPVSAEYRSNDHHADLKIAAPVQTKEPDTENKQEEVERFHATKIPDEIADDRQSLEAEDKLILIIEDDTYFAKALLDYTHKQGYKGIVAVRGDMGIQMAQQYKPLAVLLDIQLPVKDGWEVMHELKSNPHTRHIPVHIMSSMEVKKESLKMGAIDFINKPVALESMGNMFSRIEQALLHPSQKVLIIEENSKHAQALAYYLENSEVNAEIKGSVDEGIEALMKEDINCVILDMGIPDNSAYETLEAVKKTPGLENLPIIIFTGKNLSKAEEGKIKQYADSIVMKTAHSYRRILDEVALFLHLVEEKGQKDKTEKPKKAGVLNEVLKDKTVLIADDDVRNIFSLTKALETVKMKVLSATDGREALKILEDHPETDIVLMDMMMPELDGYETTSMIRKDPRFKNLPVLAVTAKAMIGDREKCIRAGASDYISKPVDIDQLISLLRVWLYDRTY